MNMDKKCKYIIHEFITDANAANCKIAINGMTAVKEVCSFGLSALQIGKIGENTCKSHRRKYEATPTNDKPWN